MKTLFQTEFLAKDLVTFDQCFAFYSRLEFSDLLAEMKLLFSPAILDIPFSQSGRRYYAFMNVLIRCAADSREVDSAQRSKLVNICIDVCEYLKRRTPDQSKASFHQALAFTLDTIDTFGLYPQVATLITQGVRDYDGPYEANAIAALA